MGDDVERIGPAFTVGELGDVIQVVAIDEHRTTVDVGKPKPMWPWLAERSRGTIWPWLSASNASPSTPTTRYAGTLVVGGASLADHRGGR